LRLSHFANTNDEPRSLPNSIHSIASSLGLNDSLKEQLRKAESLEKLHLEKFASGALATLGSTFDALAGLTICFFVAIYGAANPEAYARCSCGAARLGATAQLE